MRFFTCIIFSGIVFFTHGQPVQIDSLKRLIDKEADSKQKVKLLNRLSYHLFGYDVEMADSTTLLAQDLSQKIGDKLGEGWATAYRGVYFLLSGSLKEAEKSLTKSLQLGIDLKEIDLQAYSLNHLGNVFQSRGFFDSAYHFYQRAEKVLREKPSQLYQSVVKMSKARYYLVLNKPDSALIAANEALKLRRALTDQELIVDAWLLIGNCYRQQFEFKEAERYYDMVLRAVPKSSINYTRYLLNMGEVYFRQGDFLKALENWSRTLGFYRKLNFKYEMASLFCRMGEAFEQQGHYDLAIEYLTKSLTISEKADYKYILGEVYLELAWVFYKSKNLDLASQHIQRAQNIFKVMQYELKLAECLDLRGIILRDEEKYDSSLYYNQLSLRERERLGNRASISSGLYNSGELFNARKEYRKALSHLWRGVKIDEGIGDNYGRSLFYFQIGKTYNLLGSHDSTQFYLDKAIELAISTSAIGVLRDSYFEMAEYLRNINKAPEAITYYKQSMRLKDSLFNKRTSESLAFYSILYEVERKEQQIELLNKNSLLAKEQAQKQKILLYGALLVLLILLGLAYFYYRFAKRLKKLNREMAEKSEEIETQSEELTESNQTISRFIDTLEERIEARTSELKQAYKELDTFFYRSSHDFRRPLTTFMGLFEVAKISVKDKAALDLFEKVNETARTLDKMLLKLQSISDLGVQHLPHLEVFPLQIFEKELELFDHEIRQKNIRIEIDASSLLSFYSYPALVKIILNNLIENAIAFCAAQNPLMKLRAFKEDEGVTIVVEDNGQGIEEQYMERIFEMYFRANEHSKGNGLGLYIVKKTVEKLKGRIMISSKAGIGTNVSVYFPHQIWNDRYISNTLA